MKDQNRYWGYGPLGQDPVALFTLRYDGESIFAFYTLDRTAQEWKSNPDAGRCLFDPSTLDGMVVSDLTRKRQDELAAQFGCPTFASTFDSEQ